MPSPHPRLALVVPPQIQQQLRQLAELHHRNTSGEATVALAAWIEAHRAELDAAGGSA